MHLSINIGWEDKMSISTTILWTDISRKVNFLASNNITIRKQNVQSLTEIPDTFPLILLNKTPWVLFAIIKSNNWKEKTYRHSQGQPHNVLLNLTSVVVVTDTEGDTECHQLTSRNTVNDFSMSTFAVNTCLAPLDIFFFSNWKTSKQQKTLLYLAQFLFQPAHLNFYSS